MISKGVASVKYMSAQAADELYDLSQSNTYKSFIDLLMDIKAKTTLKSNQLEILIKIDYFSDFGNQRELFAINNIFQMFLANDGKSWKKQIKKDRVDGTELEDAVRHHSTSLTKSGKEAASYTLTDPLAIVHELEDKVFSAGLEDIGLMMKVKNFNDIMGHAGFTTGEDADRNKLFVTAVYPVKRKRDGVVFGYSILYQSIGNGKEGRMTCFKKRFEQEPIAKGDLILCKRWDRDGAYFQMLDYEHIYA